LLIHATSQTLLRVAHSNPILDKREEERTKELLAMNDIHRDSRGS
jgi:hypothetical protein